MYNHAFYFKKFQEAKMSDTTLILLSAGSSTRLNLGVKKQWLRLGETPLWLFVACNLANMAEFERVLIMANESEIFYMQRFLDDLKFKEQILLFFIKIWRKFCRNFIDKLSVFFA